MKPTIDFARVEPHQTAIHDRLRNWARWVVVRPQSRVHPMFRYYRPAQHWEPKEFRETCDILDAAAMEKIVYKLPEWHREAIRWWYVYGGPPSRACKALGLSYDGLYRHLRDGRQMLMNLVVRSAA